MGPKPNLLAQSLAPRPLRSIAEVLESQERVLAAAESAGYPHLGPFISAYHDVTEGVNEAYTRGEVAEPEVLVQAVGNFHGLFELQLHALTAGNESDIKPGWRPLLVHTAARGTHKAIQVLLGMGAHVKDDLPTLVANSDMNDRYHQFDYTLMVGGSILNTALKTASAYKPLPEVLMNSATNKVVDRIAVWREVAYTQGKLLKEAREAGDEARFKELERTISQSTWRTTTALLYGGSLALSPFMASGMLSRQVEAYKQTK